MGSPWPVHGSEVRWGSPSLASCRESCTCSVLCGLCSTISLSTYILKIIQAVQYSISLWSTCTWCAVCSTWELVRLCSDREQQTSGSERLGGAKRLKYNSESKRDDQWACCDKSINRRCKLSPRCMILMQQLRENDCFLCFKGMTVMCICFCINTMYDHHTIRFNFRVSFSFKPFFHLLL